jgi:arylsulfatase A
MRQRRFGFRPALVVLGIVLGYSVLTAEGAPGDRPPNILLIMADDLGASELGCYGNARHKTPRLDGLAKTGIRFRTCYSAPVCSPTRMMLMTGQYGFRNGWCDMRNRPGGPGDAPKSRIGEFHFTFADLLKQRGYATAVAGKWQLPGEYPTRVLDCGFDEYFIWIYKSYLPKGVDYQGGWEKPGKKYARYFHPGVMKNNKHLPTRPTDFGPDLYTDYLIDFMRRHRDRPFFAYFPMCLIHAPWGPTPDRPDLPQRNSRATLEAFVEYMDKTVGRLVDALDELGLRKNTVVMFTGDNGTYQSGKYTPTELGARVPLIVNGSGRVRAGIVSDALVDFSDFFPTLAELSGATLPTDRVIDGRSFAHVLQGTPGPTRDWAFSFLSDTRVLRDKHWLLEFNTPWDFGRFFYCGDSRDGTGYKDVTQSSDPKVRAARRRFEKILEELPAPKIPKDRSIKQHKLMLSKMAFRRK